MTPVIVPPLSRSLDDCPFFVPVPTVFVVITASVVERKSNTWRTVAPSSAEGIRVLLADSTNAEEPGHAPSETIVGGVLRTLFAENKGRRVITASFGTVASA